VPLIGWLAKTELKAQTGHNEAMKQTANRRYFYSITEERIEAQELKGDVNHT